MKVHQPNTDREATVQLFANGYACPEFVLPSAASSEPNVVECFVPVSNLETITIKGQFIGTVLHGAIDLLADGSFLSSSYMEGRSQEVRKCNRKIDFKKVFDTPQDPNDPSIYPSKDVVEGDLKAVPLEDLLPGSSQGGYGLGSLIIIISINEHTDDSYEVKPPYASLVCGDWETREEAGCDGGIVPTHELQVEVTDSNVHKNRQSKHRRHMEQTRFGAKPWVKFIFYYRSRMAIEQAGCKPRVDVSHALEAGSTKTAAVIARAAAKQKKRKGDETEEQVPEEDPAETPPQPAKKKQKLFGRQLFESGISPAVDQRDNARIPNSMPPPPPPAVRKDEPRKRYVDPFDRFPAAPPSKKPRPSDQLAALLASVEKAEKSTEAMKKDREMKLELKHKKEREVKNLEEKEIRRLKRIQAQKVEDQAELARENAELDAAIAKLEKKGKRYGGEE